MKHCLWLSDSTQPQAMWFGLVILERRHYAETCLSIHPQQVPKSTVKDSIYIDLSKPALSTVKQQCTSQLPQSLCLFPHLHSEGGRNGTEGLHPTATLINERYLILPLDCMAKIYSFHSGPHLRCFASQQIGHFTHESCSLHQVSGCLLPKTCYMS